MKTKAFIRFAAIGAFALACGIWIGRQTFVTGGNGTQFQRVLRNPASVKIE